MYTAHTYKKSLVIAILLLIANGLSAHSVKETFIKIMQDFILNKQYSIKYKSFLYSLDGKANEVSTPNSIMIKDDMCLYTNTGNVIYIINTDGSLLIDNKDKKISFNPQKLTDSEKADLITNLSEKTYKKLSESLDECDSLIVHSINGFDIYTTYTSKGPYTKAECWVNKHSNISEVRYYFREGDFLFQRIMYESFTITNSKLLTDFSNYIFVAKDKIIPTVKYKDYVVVVGK